MSKTRTIEDLRNALFETLEGVRAGKVDVEDAKAINELGKTLVDTAKVEVDYLRASGGGESEFLSTAIGNDNLPQGIPGRTVHRMK